MTMTDDLELEEEVELYFQVTFMLLSGDKIDLCARPELVAHINEWFNSDNEDLPPTISLMVEGTVMSLDRGFVGGVSGFSVFLGLNNWR